MGKQTVFDWRLWQMGRLRAGELPGPSVPVGHVWTWGVQLSRQVVRSGRPHLIRPCCQTGKPPTAPTPPWWRGRHRGDGHLSRLIGSAPERSNSKTMTATKAELWPIWQRIQKCNQDVMKHWKSDQERPHLLVRHQKSSRNPIKLLVKPFRTKIFKPLDQKHTKQNKSFPRTTMQPELSCSSVLDSLGRKWRSRTTFPTWWAATASTGSPPSECSEERKYNRCLRDKEAQEEPSCCSHPVETTHLRPWKGLTRVCFQLGGVPGAQLQRTSLHPGEEGLQQLLRLGKSEQHGGLDETNPLQLRPMRPELWPGSGQNCQLHTSSHFSNKLT